MRPLQISIIAVSLLFSSPAFAQETGTGEAITGSGANTGSGVDLEALEAARLELERLQRLDRLDRVRNFRTAIFTARSRREEYRQKRTEMRQQRRDNRIRCRFDMRRSNRDTKYDTAERCYRAELTLNLEYLRKQRPYIEGIPNINEQIRADALAEVDRLIEAISSVIDAIDIGLYASVEELQEAKEGIYEQYRKPKWLAVLYLRANRFDLWNQQLIDRIETILEEETGLPDLSADFLEESRICLEGSQTLYQSALNMELYEGAKNTMSQAHVELRSCISMLRLAHEANQDFLRSVEEVEAEETGEETEE